MKNILVLLFTIILFHNNCMAETKQEWFNKNKKILQETNITEELIRNIGKEKAEGFALIHNCFINNVPNYILFYFKKTDVDIFKNRIYIPNYAPAYRKGSLVGPLVRCDYGGWNATNFWVKE